MPISTAKTQCLRAITNMQQTSPPGTLRSTLSCELRRVSLAQSGHPRLSRGHFGHGPRPQCTRLKAMLPTTPRPRPPRPQRLQRQRQHVAKELVSVPGPKLRAATVARRALSRKVRNAEEQRVEDIARFWIQGSVHISVRVECALGITAPRCASVLVINTRRTLPRTPLLLLLVERCTSLEAL